jgi:hypothetical protein
MPLWATLIILSIVTSTGGFLLKYVISIAGSLGAIQQRFTDGDRRVAALEQFKLDHEAEHVALRNNYWERRHR